MTTSIGTVLALREREQPLFLPLWAVTTWNVRFSGCRDRQPKISEFRTFSAAKDIKRIACEGEIFACTAGREKYTTTPQLAGHMLCTGPALLFPSGGGAANIRYCAGQFCCANNYIAVSSMPQIVSIEWIYIWMTENVSVIDALFLGSGLRIPSMSRILNLILPVPSMNYQRAALAALNDMSDKMNRSRSVFVNMAERVKDIRDGIFSKIIQK